MVRFLPSAAIAIVLTVAQPYPGTAQTSSATTDARVPVFRVEIWADTLADFTNRVSAYSELRSRLESRLPAVTVTDDVGQLRRGRRSLAQAIREARPRAVQGEFFTAATSTQFQHVLASLMDAKMWAVIMGENPGAFGHDIDGAYPDGKAFATDARAHPRPAARIASRHSVSFRRTALDPVRRAGRTRSSTGCQTRSGAPTATERGRRRACLTTRRPGS